MLAISLRLSMYRRCYNRNISICANTNALSSPVTLVGRQFDTNRERLCSGPMALRALAGTGVKHRQVWVVIDNFLTENTITKLGRTRDSNPIPPDLQPYTLATRPLRQY